MLGLLRRLGILVAKVAVLAVILLLVAMVVRAIAPGEAGEILAALFLLIPVVAGYIAWTWFIPAAWCAGLFVAGWLAYRNGFATGALALAFVILLAVVIYG